MPYGRLAEDRAVDQLGPIILLAIAAIIIVPWLTFRILRLLPAGVRVIAAAFLILCPFWVGNSYELANQVILKILPFACLVAVGAVWSLLPKILTDSLAEGFRDMGAYYEHYYDDANHRKRRPR
jgi:hypothetical protein